MRKALLFCFVLLSWPAQAQQREAWQPPTLSVTRYEEDWSDLADADKRTRHWTGPFKYVPLGEEAWLSTGVELRARSESYRDNLWGGPAAPDDSYVWLRAMPYADLHVGKLRAFVQPTATYAIGMSPAPGPTDRSGIDLLQGFAEADLGGVTLRVGRQMLSLGTERLVGTRYGPNVPLAFDGLRGDMKLGPATVSLLAVKPVQPGPHGFDDSTSHTKALWGAYAASPGVDLYYLGYRNRVARFLDGKGKERRHSVGARFHGTRNLWHWNVEGVYQFGQLANRRISAWTLSTEAGRSFPALPFAPDATMRVNIVSGDDKAEDGKIGTFNALFPKGKYFGELSPIGPANIISLNPRVAGTIGNGVTASLAAMAYWRFSKVDGIYDIPGQLVRAPGESGARFVGKEVEATVAWQATEEWELSASLSAFAPGRFIRETGRTPTITMLGLESNFRF